MFKWWRERQAWKASHRVRVVHFLRNMFAVEAKPAGRMGWERVTRSWDWNGRIEPTREQPVLGLVEEMEGFASTLTAQGYANHIALHDALYAEAEREYDEHRNPPRPYDAREVLPKVNS